MPSPRLLPLAAAVVLLTAVSVAGLPSANAAVRTSTGLRCTKVGTPHNDRITGTAGRDVICGLGGNDVINGAGGNDVIDGGPGNDTISGSAGNDTLVGSTGNDALDGGAGNDSVDAGTGNDRVQGGTGNDRLAGSDGNDTISGGTGNDVLVGSSGNDAIDGGAGNDSVNAGTGNDRVQGGTGNDRLAGSDGNDTMAGSDGNDVVSGNNGNDDLSGGAGVDVVDGGTGTDWCDISSEDRQTSCVRDVQPPVIHEVHPSRASVDVTNAAATVTVLVHATDDTGIKVVSVDAFPMQGGMALDSWYGAPRVSGDTRNGWYRVGLTIPRYLASTGVYFEVQVTDRVNRGAHDESASMQVVGNDPDLDPPVLLAASVSPGTVDARRDMGFLVARARVTDAKSGVGEVWACPREPTPSGYVRGYNCLVMSLSTGTVHDGWWETEWHLPQGLLSGSWDMRICTHDRSQQQGWRCYVGPGEAAYAQANGLTLTDPTQPGTGAGFTVIGTDGDTHPPVLSSVTFSPGTVDASAGARTAHIDVAATDVEGIMNVRARLYAEDDPSRTLDTSYDPTLVSGTPQNGVWRFNVDIPGGTPAGSYWVQTWIEDNTHQLGWQPARHQDGGGYWQTYSAAQTPGGDVLVVQ